MLTLTKVLPALISSGSFTGSFYGTGSYAKKALTASYAMNGGGSGTSGTSGTSGATGTSGTSGNSGSSGTSGNSGTNGTSGNSGSSGTSGGGASLTTGSLYPITSSWSRKSITASYLTTISQSLIPAKNNTYSLGTTTVRWKDLFVSTGSIYIGDVKLSTSGSTVLANSFPIVVVNTSSKQLEVPGSTIQLTSSYANKALTASYVTGAGVGSSGTSGAAGTSGTSGVGSPGTSGTAGSSGTSSTATLQTGSLAKQTILYNVTSGSQNVITGLNLSGNKWGVDIKEEWDAKSGGGDQYFSNVVLLLPFTGSNGSTTMTNVSQYNLPFTAYGNAQLSTAQYKFPPTSLYLDGNGDYLTTPNTASLLLGISDFTIECFLYLTQNGTTSFGETYAPIIQLGNYFADASNSRVFYSFIYNVQAGNRLSFGTKGGNSFNVPDYYAASSNAINIPLNTWVHVAVTRTSNQLKFWYNGNLVGTDSTYSWNSINLNVNPGANNNLYIGRMSGTSIVDQALWYFPGYISNIRITKGVARYTDTFVTSSVAFPKTGVQVQYATKYVGLIGGLNDKTVDYGVQKLSDSSLKVVKMSQTTSPFPSGSLSSSVDRVYVNILDYNKVSVTSSYATNALTASYILGGGANGSSGTSGNNGTSGTSGTSSTAGSSGTSGQNGTSATAGSSGSSGSSGTSGTTGSSGSSGSSGNNGTSGSSGATGASGSSGTSGGGASLTTGSLYPITSSWSRRSLTASYALNASGGGSSLAGAQTFISNGSQTVYTLNQSVVNRDQILVVTNGVVQSRTGSNYTVSGTTLTLSEAVQSGGLVDVRYINAGQGSSGTSGINGTVQTGSIAKQTILYNVTSGSQNVITGLNLSGNKWGVDIKEEWDAVIVAGDQYYNSCSLLLHFDGTNGSTTITDNSKNNFTVTAANGAVISTAQSKFGGASVFFDGTNDYVSIPDNEALELGTNNLTWEMWIKTTSSVQYATLYCREPSAFGSGMWTLMINQSSSTAGDIALYLGDLSGAVPLLLTTGVSIRDDVWHHIAIVRNGSAWACYVDGTSRATGTYSGGIGNISAVTLIGADQNVPGRNFAGYIDELRITKGVARYTGNFTPQTSAFPNSIGVTQYATKYIGLIGGLNDRSVDYGVQKLSDSSLKVVKMSQTTSPFPSGSLSSSVDRVYVNVLDYSKVAVTSSYATRALTASYSLKNDNALRTGSLYPITASRAVSSSYLLNGTQILTANKTVSFSSSFTTTQMQTLIDAQPKNLGGKTLTFKFANGTYILTSTLEFFGFSNGNIYIDGNSSNNTATNAKNVNISGSSNTYVMSVNSNSAYVNIRYIKAVVSTTGYHPVILYTNTTGLIQYCSFTNNPASTSAGTSNGIQAVDNGCIKVNSCYFNYMERYMVADVNGKIAALNNVQGNNSAIAYYAYGGIIHIFNTGLTGVTTYVNTNGGLTIRPSGATVGT